VGIGLPKKMVCGPSLNFKPQTINPPISTHAIFLF
jgi:hypothetical protein